MTTKPRVAIVCHYLPPHEGGIERVVARLAAEYRALGVDATVIGWAPRSTPVEPDQVALRGLNVLEAHGVPVPIIEPVSSWRAVARTFDGVQGVHTHGLAYPACALALHLARRRGLPAIATEHVGAIPYDRAVLRVVQDVVLHVTGRMARRSVVAVTVLNERVRDEMGALVPGVKVVSVPNGVDSVQFRPASPEERVELRRRFALERPTVLSVGRHVPKKGFERLVEAAARTPSPPPFDVLFVGRGTGPLTGTGVAAIEALDQAELAALYRAVDVLVLPSEGEGVPLVVQEALASGLPVVLGDDPAVRAELPEGPVTFVAVHDVGAIRAAIDGLVTEPRRRPVLAEMAREEAVRRFDWAASARCYLGLLGLAPPEH